MKSPWVKDLTIFFENLGKPNIRHSFKKKHNTRPMDVQVDIRGMPRCREDVNEIDKKSNCEEEDEKHCSSSGSEHCYTVKSAKDMFERLGSTDRTDSSRIHKGSMNEIDHSKIHKQKSQMKKQISVYDIFSGAVIDLDIPPIDDDQEEDQEDDGVFENEYTARSRQPMTATFSHNVTPRQLLDKKKTLQKSPSYAERKSVFKKGANNFKSVATESDIDKENNGVIIRMKNQESYYDGRTKYKSLLPEVPLHQVVDGKRVRKSLLTQKALDKSIDVVGEDELGRDPRYMNSILFEEVSLPSIEVNHCHNNLDKTSAGGGSEDDDSDELEPNGECDSYSEVKLSQLFSLGPQRIKWAETEEGMKIIKLKGLASDIIKWQEAQFEVITSEASYYQSLQILVNKIYKNPFMVCQGEKKQFSFENDSALETNGCQSPTTQPVMTALQKHHLFSNILEIHICSGELLKALETRWRENPFIEDLSDILVEFSKEKLKPYVTYIRNQQYQTSTYNHLLTNPDFQNVIRNIETDIDCGMMNLSSFLLLPMQRLLRLKLLFAVVRRYIPPGYPVQGCDNALASIEGLIKACSDQKMLMEQKEEIMIIYNRLIFKQQTGVSIGSKPLLKNGQMKVSPSNNKASKSLNSSFLNRNNSKAQLYLFEDQLIIAKTRKLPLCLSSDDNKEMVVDICPRSNVTFELCITRPLFAAKNSFKLILTKGLKGSAEYTCETDSKSDLEDWQNAFSPAETNEWEDFEFNDVLVTKDYNATSSKELDLCRGQILRIIKRINEHRAIASSGDREGEIPMSHVQVVCPPQASPEMLQEIRESITHKKVD